MIREKVDRIYEIQEKKRQKEAEEIQKNFEAMLKSVNDNTVRDIRYQKRKAIEAKIERYKENRQKNKKGPDTSAKAKKKAELTNLRMMKYFDSKK
jgi:hypothetical protein